MPGEVLESKGVTMGRKSVVLDSDFQFSTDQIDRIADRLAPLLAAPDDQDFFRAVLKIKGYDSKSSSAFVAFLQTAMNHCSGHTD